MEVSGGAGGQGRPTRALFGLAGGAGGGGPDDEMVLAHRATEELRAAATLMSDAQRVANFGSWEWRVAEDSVSWSEQLYRIFGLDPEHFEATFDAYLQHVHPDDRETVEREIEGAIQEKRPYRFEHRIVRPGGEERAVRCHGEPVLDPAGEVSRMVGVCQDVTELVLTERARAEADARFRSAFENAPIGIALVDFQAGVEGRLTEVNRSLTELTARSASELVGAPLSALCLAEDADSDLPLRERLLAGELDGYTIEKRCLLDGDRLTWLQLNVSLIGASRGTDGHGIVQVQDVTERKRFEQQLRYIADHDSLTGLHNRRRFREELDSQVALKQRYGGEGAVLLLDVDRLKEINDTAGHGAGDDLLRRVGEALQARVRSTDVVARLAGDEFAVMLPNGGRAEAEAVAADLVARLAGEQVSGLSISVSVGVTVFGSEEHGSAEDVLSAADAAMYRAKQRGGEVVAMADEGERVHPHSRTASRWFPHLRQGEAMPAPAPAPDLSHDPRRSVAPTVPDGAIGERVRAALAAERLVLYAQPALDLRTGTIAHRELLVRMRDENGTVLPATDFLGAAAQQHGLCAEIDRWVVRGARRVLAANGTPGRLQVNLSGETLTSEAAMEALVQEVAGVEPGRIAFEIGESLVRRDIERTLEALRHLGSATGCPLVLDGFSAAFGSFEYLQRLPVDQIKIDGSVVRSLHGDDPDHATLRAIVRIAQGTDTSTVAKLVESGAVLPILRMHGVDMAQGYEIGEPQPLPA